MRTTTLLCLTVELRTLFLTSVILDFIFFPNVILFLLALLAWMKYNPTRNYAQTIVVVYCWAKLVVSLILATVMWVPLVMNAENLSRINGYCYIIIEEGGDCEDEFIERERFIAGVVISIIFIVYYTINFIVALQLFWALRPCSKSTMPTSDGLPVEPDEPIVQSVVLPDFNVSYGGEKMILTSSHAPTQLTYVYDPQVGASGVRF